MSEVTNKDEVITDVKPLEEKKISEMKRLVLAKSILLCLAVLYLAGMVLSAFSMDDEIFDACKTVLPPIATLIIGYYFGERSGK